MPEYDHDLLFGLSVPPSAREQRLDETQIAIEHLSDALLAHLRYEEDTLLGPMGRWAIRI